MSALGRRTAIAGIMILLPFVSALSPAAAAVNPHRGDIVCTACHVDEDGPELRIKDVTLLCDSCHWEFPLGADHHPLGRVGEVSVPLDWPVNDGNLTCLTCHLPSHHKYADKYKFLRVYNEVRPQDFCTRCHWAPLWRARNPHAEANEGNRCDLCHPTAPQPGKDTLSSVTFYGAPTVLCLRCHVTPLHPGGHNHVAPIDAETAAYVSKKAPLFENNRISCSTCHNPHILETENHKLRPIAHEGRECPDCHRP